MSSGKEILKQISERGKYHDREDKIDKQEIARQAREIAREYGGDKLDQEKVDRAIKITLGDPDEGE